MSTPRRADTTKGGVKTRIIWDDSKMRSHKPRVLEVSSGREELILSFMRDETRDTGGGGKTVQFSDRIVMSPFTAKRLAALLGNVIREYESKYGSLDIKASPETRPDQYPTPRTEFSKTRKPDQKIGLLLQLLKELEVEVGLERSFKVSEKTLLGNRFLLGTSKRAIRKEPQARILHICERLDMPDNLLETFQKNLADANYVHFGFEENVTTCIYKVYLEFYDKIGKEVKSRRNGSDHFLLHLGFKWDVSDNTKHALTKYTWYPFLSVDEILVRLSAILDPRRHGKPLEIATGIMNTAYSRVTHDKILYLEVSEENNPRRSFDINMYKAGLQVKELYPLLSKMFQHYSVPRKEFRALYDQAKTKRFGHLSGGIDREGKDFLTVYYGVEGYSIQNHTSDSDLFERRSPQAAIVGQPQSIHRPFPKTGRADQKAIQLLQLMENLNVKYGFERSFKVYEKTFLPNRFLVAFKRHAISHQPSERILDLCKRIDMPGDFLKGFKENLPEANVVLFGIEENETTCVYKAYLEFWDKVKNAVRSKADRCHPLLLFLGFKWDTSDNTKRVLSKYTCFPLISVETMLEQVSDIFNNHKNASSYEILEGIVSLASSKAPKDTFIYLEVEEEGNPRRSFDINMYDANLQLRELYPHFIKMCHHYSIPSREFHSVYEPVKTHTFGHVSGGVDRKGRDFLTVYFGKKVESDRLR